MVADLLILTAVAVFVVDLSGFSDTLLGIVNGWLRPYGRELHSLRPFTCSLCATWWLGLLYLIIAREFSLVGVGLVALCAFSTTAVANALMLAKDTALALVDFLQRLVDKIR